MECTHATLGVTVVARMIKHMAIQPRSPTDDVVAYPEVMAQPIDQSGRGPAACCCHPASASCVPDILV
jgi:hypothetical protein